MMTLTRDGIRYRVKFHHWIPRYIMRHDAMAWSRVIYVRSGWCPADLHCHEFEHLKQQEREGLWRFWWRYTLANIRHGYRGVHYEQEAYRIQSHAATVATFADLGVRP